VNKNRLQQFEGGSFILQPNKKRKNNMLPDDGNQQQPAGGTESPASSPSGGQGQQLSPDVDALMKRLDDQDKLIRGLQKGIDKRFERQDGNIKRILELKEQGLDERGIERELLLDSLIAGQRQDAPPPTPEGNERQGQAADVESAFKVLEEYSLPQNDPDFIALVRQSSRMDKTAFEAKVKDFVLGKVKPPKSANPADVVQPPARSGAQGVNVDQLNAELSRLAVTPSAPGAMQRMVEIQKQLREAG
jgi:hypothetical protein